MSDIDKTRVIELLNRILESELAGVIRYTHYSFLVYGYNRIPIVAWLRAQANPDGNWLPKGLRPSGMRVAIMDVSGRGQSPRPMGSSPRLAELR